MKIGLITSGGDSPGMNGTIESIVHEAVALKYEIIGFKDGLRGIVENKTMPLTIKDVEGISKTGGSILGSSRFKEFKNGEQQKIAIANLEKNKIDLLIIIGGNGSLQATQKLDKLGVKVIGIPGTIDNDAEGTEHTIGFDTALNTSIESIEKIEDSAKSHKRNFVVELMGNHCGNISYNTFLAGVGTFVVVQEFPMSIEDVAKKVKDNDYNVIIFSEGVGNVNTFARNLEKVLGKEVVPVKLGHVQRGGNPTGRDRVIAKLMGQKAIAIAHDIQEGQYIVIKNGSVTSIPIKTIKFKNNGHIGDKESFLHNLSLRTLG